MGHHNSSPSKDRCNRRRRRMWAGTWVSVVLWACLSPVILTPTGAFFTSETRPSPPDGGDVVGALNRIVQVLDSHERHTALYERVSKLEENLNKKTENERKLEEEVLDLRAKIPALEAEIQTIPEMRKDLAEFEAKIEKLVHDYEAKLSALASEVIRLKKYGARRKDLQTLSDGSDNVLLRTDVPTCPEVGLGMAAERVGDQCLYFSWATALNWTDAHRHCQSLGGDLSAPEDLLPLKTFLHAEFARGPSIWLGASYKLDDEGNITHTTAERKALSTPSSPSQEAAEPEGDHDGTFSFRLNIEGSSFDLAKNTIDDEESDGGGSQDDEPISTVLSDGIPLRDEAIIIPKGDLSTLSQRLGGRRNLFGQLSQEELNARIQKLSKPPVVDFILLDSARPSSPGDTENPEEEKHTSSSSDLTSGGNASLDSRPGISSILNGESPLVGSHGGSSSGVFRDVRQVLDEGSGTGAPEAREDEAKANSRVKMNCILLQQKESLEYELVSQPCNEQHRFVCGIFSSKNNDMKFNPDNLLHE
ncbi:uncharacterized protein LOC135219153 [Macrobrachium nipponense]|uniref:uncharacterized protein LOC135219153 n=1 Tax=Macrobrachium nipponense TaxID=159736 RepID=UPI0030C7CE48